MYFFFGMTRCSALQAHSPAHAIGSNTIVFADFRTYRLVARRGDTMLHNSKECGMDSLTKF